MLFRREALEAQQQARLGSIQLLRPLSMQLLTAVAVGSVALVLAFLFSAEYTRKAHVSGYLVPDRGLLRVAPPQSAIVLERRVAEGQAVHAGDVLFVLSLDAASEAGEGVARSLAQRERSLTQAAAQAQRLAREQGQGLAARSAALERELAQAATEARLQAERLTLARQSLARLESLSRDQFVSEAQVQAKREELLGLQAQAQTLERERESLRRDLLNLQAQARELPLRAEAQQGEIARDLATLQAQGLETEARRRLVLRAPIDGVLSTLQGEPGQPVGPATTLAQLLPQQARLQAQLYAPSSAVGFLRPEQTVQLRYQAFPYQKFGHQLGRVVQVARAPLAGAELAALPLGAAPAGEPLYRITVALERQNVQAYGEAQALSPGMQLDADVLLERRRLIEWIFEPLLSVAGRV